MLGDAFEFAIIYDLSRLLMCPEVVNRPDLEFLSELAEPDQQEFLAIADAHRILVRSLRVLQAQATISSTELPEWVSSILSDEEKKLQEAVRVLAEVYNMLSAAGFSAVVIKSLDHWPDLGSDFDIYTAGPAEDLRKLMQEKFNSRPQAQSWSDRLAGKWRFAISGFNKMVEIHLGGLGQTGQQAHMGRMVLSRGVTKAFGNNEFSIPSPEDQILIRTIDRCYRHYSLRICDLVDSVETFRGNTIDFDYLKSESKRAGIRKGVCSYLSIVDGYYSRYRDEHLSLPAWVRKGASFSASKIYGHAGLLRIPLFPQGARLFRHELTKAIRRKDIKKAMRTSLIPPLAVAAGARYRIRGRDKGVW